MSPESTKRSGTRLSPGQEGSFAPWIEAATITDVHVLWLGVSAFPLRHAERAWLLHFLQRLAACLTGRGSLREEVFLHLSAASGPLAETFNRYTTQAQVLPGLSRKPGEALQGKADVDTVRDEIAETQSFDFTKWTSDYAIWFQHKRPEEQREMFWGHGGMSLLFLPSDPKTAPPRLPFTPKFKAAVPMFQHMDIEALVAGAMALQDDFLPRSKALFGVGLESEIDMKSVAFVVPAFASRHLVQAPPELREQWFGFFEVFCRESVEDGGILLALRHEHADALREVLAAMEEEGWRYGQAQPVR